MEIQNASTTPSKSNQLQNVNTVRVHQLTRDNTFALIRSCETEVYKVEKLK